MIDLLAIAAHPDDVEQTCGGTLLKMAEAGYRTGIIDLTAGDMGTRGSPEIRVAESEAAARILKAGHRENAIKLVNQAISEVELGIKAGAQ